MRAHSIVILTTGGAVRKGQGRGQEGRPMVLSYTVLLSSHNVVLRCVAMQYYLTL